MHLIVPSHIAKLTCDAKDLVCLDECVSVNILVECRAYDAPYVMRKITGLSE
jgi:hypothetical protein